MPVTVAQESDLIGIGSNLPRTCRVPSYRLRVSWLLVAEETHGFPEYSERKQHRKTIGFVIGRGDTVAGMAIGRIQA